LSCQIKFILGIFFTFCEWWKDLFQTFFITVSGELDQSYLQKVFKGFCNTHRQIFWFRVSHFGFCFVLDIFFLYPWSPPAHPLTHVEHLFYTLFMLIFAFVWAPTTIHLLLFLCGSKTKKNPHGYYLKISTVGIGKERVGQSGAQEHAEMALD